MLHTFDNGVKVIESHLIPIQKERYNVNNIHEPEEEPIFLNAISEIPSNGTYVNIGAGIGYYLILASLKRSDVKIYGYEPLRDHFIKIKKNLSINGIKKNKVRLVRKGVSYETASAILRKIDYGSSIQSKNNINMQLSYKNRILKRKLYEKIDTVSLYDVVCLTGSIDLLQLDIQGHELRVFESIELKLEEMKIQSIITGTHGKEIHKKLLNIFEKNNYDVIYENQDTKTQPDGIIYVKRRAKTI